MKVNSDTIDTPEINRVVPDIVDNIVGGSSMSDLQ